MKRTSKAAQPYYRQPSAEDWTKAEQRAKPRERRCGHCGEPGHTIRACPVLSRKHR